MPTLQEDRSTARATPLLGARLSRNPDTRSVQIGLIWTLLVHLLLLLLAPQVFRSEFVPGGSSSRGPMRAISISKSPRVARRQAPPKNRPSFEIRRDQPRRQQQHSGQHHEFCRAEPAGRAAGARQEQHPAHAQDRGKERSRKRLANRDRPAAKARANLAGSARSGTTGRRGAERRAKKQEVPRLAS